MCVDFSWQVPVVLTELCCRDGRLRERDQILVINGSPLEPGLSHQQALSLLQQPGETVELVVARDAVSEGDPVGTVSLFGPEPEPVHEDDQGSVPDRADLWVCF